MNNLSESGEKRSFSVLSPGSPLPSEKRMAMSTSPVSLPEGTPEWAKCLHDSLQHRMGELESSVNESINFAVDISNKALHNTQDNKLKIEELEQENQNLHTKVDTLTERLIKLESYGRRDNLLLHGIPERPQENCADLVLKTLSDAGITMETDRPFVRVHRNPPGPPSMNRNRPIIIRFHHFHDRMTVWKHRGNVQGAHLTEDFPAEIQANRRQLVPYLALAKTLDSVKNCKLVEDRLIINSKVYTVKTLRSLPAELNPGAVATRTKDDKTAFYTKESPLSNYHAASFSIDGHKYHTVEQYYQTKKADYSGDKEALNKIMQTSDPRLATSYGKSVQLPVEKKEKWRKSIGPLEMKKAMMAKFMENPRSRKFLVETGENQLLEASLDRFWGIGKRISDPTLFDKNFPGGNVCGKMLMEVRSQLKDKR